MNGINPIQDLKGYLEPCNIVRLIQAATNPRDALLVRIPWRTGIKVSELIGIRLQDIEFKERAIFIKSKKVNKKAGKAVERKRVVPVDEGTLDMIKGYLRWRKQFPYKGDLLFPITRQRVNQIFWKLEKKVGAKKIDDPAVSKYTKFHPHLMRHSFSIHCIKCGMAIEILYKILGRSSPATDSVYPQYSLADFHKEYDRVWENEGT